MNCQLTKDWAHFPHKTVLGCDQVHSFAHPENIPDRFREDHGRPTIRQSSVQIPQVSRVRRTLPENAYPPAKVHALIGST